MLLLLLKEPNESDFTPTKLWYFIFVHNTIQRINHYPVAKY